MLLKHDVEMNLLARIFKEFKDLKSIHETILSDSFDYFFTFLSIH